MVDGMEDLLRWLHKNDAEVVIISDCNNVFIDTILEKHNLQECVKRVYTNPVTIDKDDMLKIKYYHTQDWCDLSTVNLCKGTVLEDHLKARRADDGVSFETIAYAGDGGNDLCPCVRLVQKDLVFPRESFTLIKAIAKYKDPLRATVVPWNTGNDIRKALENKV